tara:strand:- start:12256 stop:12996 length:741 start_codon:yes stop_codon:yes gene_type:complete
MIKRIKRIVNELIQSQRKQVVVQNQLLNGQNQLWASQKLNALLGVSHFIPFTGWSMTPQAIVHCLNIINMQETKHIIEFGSGATTVYIAQLLKLQKEPAVFYSIESDLNWKTKLEGQLTNLGLHDYVKIIHCPLKEIVSDLSYKDQKTWYDVEILEAEIGKLIFDFVIVDGPFGGSTPYARYSAYPFLKKNSHKETVWFLDDTNRTSELEIIKTWQAQSNLRLSSHHRYGLLFNESKFDAHPYAFQ